jgi:glycosyltransferase involved in cell wall biosynthesis
MIKILLLSRYSRLGASSRVRSYNYLPYLKAHGFHITVSPLLNDDYIKCLYDCKVQRLCSILGAYIRRLRHLLTSNRYDLLWIEKELFPWFPACVERLFTRIGVPYLIDYDDAIFHRYDMHSIKLIRLILGGKIDALVRRAALVIVGNDYLAKRAILAGARRVEQLPSVIDLDRYPPVPQSKNAVFTIGWIGSPVTSHYLHIVRPALTEVCQGGKGRLVLIGSGQIEFKGVTTAIRPWSEETEVTDIHTFDVGIMPLSDGPWERGKCGYKLVQYMACSKPVVASPVGVNKQIVENGVNGFLASTTTDWVCALTTLRDDPLLREHMGEAARRKVEMKYCIQVTAPQLSKFLLSVARRYHSNIQR